MNNLNRYELTRAKNDQHVYDVSVNNEKSVSHSTFDQANIALLTLPIEIIQEVATYLNADELGFWRRCCKQLHTHLPLKDFPNQMAHKAVSYVGLFIETSCPRAREKQLIQDKSLLFSWLKTHGNNVTRLNLSALSTHCSDEDIKTIVPSLPKLQILRLSSCKKLTDAGLKSLNMLSQLRVLDLQETEIDGSGLMYLKDNTSLETILLNRCHKITDNGLTSLKNLSSLKKINLAGCNLITDDGLVHFKDSSLKKLVLGSDLITDRGLEKLQNVKFLKILKLFHCNNITFKGLQFLRELNPPICKHIYWNKYRVENNPEPLILNYFGSMTRRIPKCMPQPCCPRPVVDLFPCF